MKEERLATLNDINEFIYRTPMAGQFEIIYAAKNDHALLIAKNSEYASMLRVCTVVNESQVDDDLQANFLKDGKELIIVSGNNIEILADSLYEYIMILAFA